MKIIKDLNQLKSHFYCDASWASLTTSICYDHRPNSSLEKFALTIDEN